MQETVVNNSNINESQSSVSTTTAAANVPTQSAVESNNNNNSTLTANIIPNTLTTNKVSNLLRSSSFNKSMESPNKIQAIIFTNTDDLDNLNCISNDTLQSPAILYENDFDLYSLLKEMIKNPQLKSKRNSLTGGTPQTPEPSSAASEQMTQAKRKVIYKNYTKQLTAQRNDINYTDGKTNWLLQNNDALMYSKHINCIGTSINDCDFSESIFLDLQPLSTRIKLMCKLVIIIQGACVERFGPPKLVQDRCLQFDGENDLKPKPTADATSNNKSNATVDTTNSASPNGSGSTTNMSKGRSNSCEDLLLETSSSATTTTTTTTTFDAEHNVYKINNQIIENENIIIKRKRQDSAPNIIEKALADTTDKFYNEDEKDPKHYSKKHYDLENYYRHRMSRYSLKDYASVPYYQYSRRVVKRLDKSVNTDESFLTELLEKIKVESETQSNEEKKQQEINVQNTATSVIQTKKDCSTCTSDLIDSFYLGYYSKTQLLSPYTLHNTHSTLWNAYSNTELDLSKETKTEYYYSYSKEYVVGPNGGLSVKEPQATHVSGFTIQTNDLSSLRQRPQRTSDWSLFNKDDDRVTTKHITIQPPPIPPTRHMAPNFRYTPPHRFTQRAPPPIPPRPTTSRNHASNITIANIRAAKF